VEATRRTFRCEGCGDVFETPARRGRLPRACDECDPTRAHKRRYEQLIRLETDILSRAQRQSSPSMEQVAALFVQSARSKGSKDRANLLLELASAAIALAIYLKSR
jgi:hypothetical protein